MTKRPKGQTPYESPHPNRPEMPDVPGHRQRRGIVVNAEQKRELNRQIEKLKREIVGGSGTEKKG